MREGENNIFYLKNNEGKINRTDGENQAKDGEVINFWNPTVKELELIRETGRMPESLIIRRVNECLAKEGLLRRLNAPDDEIEEFLQKKGYQPERDVPPREKLFFYITEKYREEIFKEQNEREK
ncbi:MAG: hypothetical protein V3574_03225 [Candidatus Moraniibacteriota bacterium]